VESWNRRATESRADERVVYRGDDAAEAVRVYEGLKRWKRRGLVVMMSPRGFVSQLTRTGDTAKDWETRYAHLDAKPIP
jgi:hypothetical protein